MKRQYAKGQGHIMSERADDRSGSEAVGVCSAHTHLEKLVFLVGTNYLMNGISFVLGTP